MLADVITVKLGRKAAAAGADGLVCVSAGAGGHTGFLSPFAFVSALRSEFAGLICVGGGIADGAGLAGAIAAGADLVYMGTRFLAAEESVAAPDYKAMVIVSALEDLVVSSAVTGTPASWLAPSLIAAGYDTAALDRPAVREYGGDPAKKWKDLWAAGQGIGRVRANETVEAIVDTIAVEFGAAQVRLARYSPGT